MMALGVMPPYPIPAVPVPMVAAPVALLWRTKATPSPPAVAGPIWKRKCACKEVAVVSEIGVVRNAEPASLTTASVSRISELSASNAFWFRVKVVSGAWKLQ